VSWPNLRPRSEILISMERGIPSGDLEGCLNHTLNLSYIMLVIYIFFKADSKQKGNFVVIVISSVKDLQISPPGNIMIYLLLL